MMSSSSPSQDSSSPQSSEPLKPDEITALEYTSLKVPYELFNKRFRSSQKTMEKNNHFLKESADLVAKAMKGDGTKPIYKREVKEKMDTYFGRFEELFSAFKQITDEEIELIDLLDTRVKYLQQANTTDALKQETWRSQRISRLIIDYLLRSGYFETAQKLAEQANVEDMCNKTVFMIAKQVEDSLSRHETDRCLEWIADNRSKLRRLKSTLETMVRLQDCIELVRRGERLEAVHYARKFLANLPKDQWSEQVVKVMGLIGFGIPSKSRAYDEYFSDKRWDQLIELFKQENARVYKLMDYSSFNACLCMGLSAYKSPQCHPDPDSRCPTCRPDMYELAEDLPHSHVSNSRLMCAYSGEPMDDDNEPFMLPNGYVYGANSIEKLLNTSDEIVCPRTGEIYPANQLLRVFVL
ncbi:E3 ubiquitin-protein transferase MAEA [Dirofilaria immitis]